MHEEYGFSFEYPVIWNMRLFGENGNRGNRVNKVSIDNFRRGFDEPNAVIRINLKEFSEPNLNDVIDWSIENLDRLPSKEGLQYPLGYQELIYQRETVGIGEIQRRRYVQFNNSNHVTEEVMIARSDDMIIITVFAHPDIFHVIYPDFERIVSSFQTTEP
ncbi:MAG: hypothetical protein AB8G95_28565 [Anaerolineae bacterium]